MHHICQSNLLFIVDMNAFLSIAFDLRTSACSWSLIPIWGGSVVSGSNSSLYHNNTGADQLKEKTTLELEGRS